MACDLHTHSTASDGTDAPQALPGLARQAGLQVLALTDHDTTAGLARAMTAAAGAGVTLVPGIELSARRADLTVRTAVMTEEEAASTRGTLHILGLFIEPVSPALATLAQEAQVARAERNPQIITRLQGLGVRIEYQEVLDLVQRQGGGVVGRPHIAQALVNKGYAKSVQDAFARYLGHGRPGYVRKDHLGARRAIAAIHAAGGLAVLAHPVQLRCADDDELEHAVKLLADWGLDALEVWHSDHTPADVDKFRNLAPRYSLLASGGSDYHGPRKPVALGSQPVPLEIYEQLRQRATMSRTPAPR